MKLIDRSPYPVKPEGLDLYTRIRGTLQFGFSWPAEVQAQEACIKVLKRYFNDHYTLLRNLALSDLDVPIPMILVGPPGIYVIYVSAQKGAFRAQGEDWLILQTGRGYIPIRPNLVLRTSLMARALDIYLKRSDGIFPDIQGIMLFMNPRIFVETVRPVIRVVMSDAVEKFVSGLIQAQPILSPNGVEAVVTALINPPAEPQPVEIPPEIPAPKPSRPKKAAPQIRFTNRQWFILGILITLFICVLLAVIVVSAITP